MFSNNGSQSVVLGPAASVSPEKTDVQIYKLQPRPINSYSGGRGSHMCFNGSPQILMKVSLRAINLKGDICTASQRFFQESVFAVNILEDQGTSDDALTSITEHLSECENTF